MEDKRTYRRAKEEPAFEPALDRLDVSEGDFLPIPAELVDRFFPAYPEAKNAFMFLISMARATWGAPKRPKWVRLTRPEMLAMIGPSATESGADKMIAFLRHEAKVLIVRKHERYLWYSVDYKKMRKLKPKTA